MFLVCTGNSLSRHNGHKFSTKDKDNDSQAPYNCAQRYKGAWWYADCHDSNLNAVYQPTGAHNMTSFADHVDWEHWRGHYYSLKFTEMKIRPVDF